MSDRRHSKNFMEEADVALTVCKKDGEIVYMNQKSRKTFLKPGMPDIIGQNVLDCHPEPARTLLNDLLIHPRNNAYTIEKNGVKKLIFQTPWYDKGEYAGFMELSMEIPFQMKHMVRTPGTGHPTAGTGNHAAGTGNHAAGTGNHAAGTGNHVAGTGNHAAGNGNYAAGTGSSRSDSASNRNVGEAPQQQKSQPQKPQRKRCSPNSIFELKPNEVFVFGSNLSGSHGGGAARVAYEKFGAVWGEGVGHFGQTYAIPTMQGGVETIKPYVDQFIAYAMQHFELTFLVTRIGCGIAGFKDEDIAPLFKAAMKVDNILLPGSFVKVIENL